MCLQKLSMEDKAMNIEQWPNKLGYNVETDDYVAEVWQSRFDGIWGVRTFIGGDPEAMMPHVRYGTPHKWIEIDPSEYLFMTPQDAAAICYGSGNPDFD